MFLRPVTANRFAVLVSGVPLGSFQSVSGMGFDIAVEKLEEGGENAALHQLPGRMTWQNIVLKAGVVRVDALLRWATAAPDPATSLTVVLLDEAAVPARMWTFLQAMPVSWKGPDLSTAADEIATQTLEVAHHGLDPASF